MLKLMLMATLTRRLQLLVEEERFIELERLAVQRSTTVAALVRDALDQAFPRRGLPHATAAVRFLARPPVEFEDWGALKAEIEDGLARRAGG